MYSATPLNYLASDSATAWPTAGWGGPLGRSERRLFPGVAAIGLAFIGLWGWSPRKTTSSLIGLTGFVLSLGLNSPVYGWVREVVFTYRGLRAPARAGILVLLAISLLAAFGWAAILTPRSRDGAWSAPAWSLGRAHGRVRATPREWLALPIAPPARCALARAAAPQRRHGVAVAQRRTRCTRFRTGSTCTRARSTGSQS